MSLRDIHHFDVRQNGRTPHLGAFLQILFYVLQILILIFIND